MKSTACSEGRHLDCEEDLAAFEGGIGGCRCPCHFADDEFDADELGLDPETHDLEWS